MPELPEVETVKRGLDKLILGVKIQDVKIYNEKSFQASLNDKDAFLIGAEVQEIRRRGKAIIINLSTGYAMVIHLKMTGQLVFRGKDNWAAGHPNDSFVADLPDRSTRIEFILDSGKLFFNDQRKFGWVKLLPQVEVANIDFLKKLGPEPLSGDPNLPQIFLKNIRRHNNTNIKAAILNQSVIAGIGNIYADESLFAAKIHPATKVCGISDSDLINLLNCAISSMKKSIESGGSTMKTYIKADGTKGNYLDKFAQVFRREGQPCPVCGTEIEKTRVAGRGTHFCPNCQNI